MKRKYLLIYLSVISLLFIFSLACKQSGEILTPAEATQNAEATQAVLDGVVVSVIEGAEFSPGDNAILNSQGHLVGLFKEAGGSVAYSYASRGDKVIVVGSTEVDGELWYKIETSAGNGWLPGIELSASE